MRNAEETLQAQAPMPPSRRATGWLRYAAYPLLLLGNSGIAYYALTNDLPLGPVSFVTVIGTMVYLLIIERIVPYRTTWHTNARELRRDGIYFVLVMLVGAAGQGLMSAVTVRLAALGSSHPLWLEAIAALLVSAFFGYWFHRIGHLDGWLWKVHGVHHVPDKVNLTNNSVVHFFDTLGSGLASGIAMLLLGFSEQAVFLVTLLTITQGYTSHCNADMRLGWLNYVVCGPQQHRLHHSTRLEEAGHYGVDITLWDHVFRSFTWRPGKEPRAVGVANPEQFPAASSIVASALHPFRRLRVLPDTRTVPARVQNQ